MKQIFLFILGTFIFSCTKTASVKETPTTPIQVVDSIVSTDQKESENEVVQNDQIIFKVQIAALKNSNAILAKLKNVTITQENSLIKYRLGDFESYKEARSYRKQLLGSYQGAFVQALRNGVPISITEAIQD